jgi:hypothetical protein
MCELDGDIWLPKGRFHAYEGPSAFGPNTKWDTELAADSI